MTLPWGLTTGSLTELGGVAAAVLGTGLSVLYTRYTFQLTQQPAWRITVGEVSYYSLNEDGVATPGADTTVTEWAIQNVGKLGALEVTATLKLDRRVHASRGLSLQPATFPIMKPDETLIIAGGQYETWPTWRDYADGIARLNTFRPVRNRVLVEWIDTRNKQRHRKVQIAHRVPATRVLPAGESVPMHLQGKPRPTD